LAGVVAGVVARFGLAGVVHAAGVLDDGAVLSLTGSRVAGVFGVKAAAGWYLHELTRGLDLGLFVVFSSVAGVFGSPGQGNYAAANAFLDGLVAHRRAHGLAGTSLAWGLWEPAGGGGAGGGGMAGGLDGADLARLGRWGMAGLSAEQGLALFDAALRADRPLAVAARLELAGWSAGAVPALLTNLVRRGLPRAAGSGADTDPATLRTRLAGLTDTDRQHTLLELVRARVATVLGHTNPEHIPPQRPFTDLGFDSLTAVELRNQLTTATGLHLPATLIFDHPTPTALTNHLHTKLTPGQDETSETVLRELDVIESGLSLMAHDEPGRTEIARRLEALAKIYRGEGRSDDQEGEAVAQRLQSSSDEEVFDFIDKQLGV
jgi:polyketide synthase 12